MLVYKPSLTHESADVEESSQEKWGERSEACGTFSLKRDADPGRAFRCGRKIAADIIA